MDRAAGPPVVSVLDSATSKGWKAELTQAVKDRWICPDRRTDRQRDISIHGGPEKTHDTDAKVTNNN